MSTIIHIDFDSFFASAEQQNNPGLRNKPVGVIATHSRSCIIAASREAKKMGVKTGCRSFDAYKLCPDILLVPANFVNYLEISKKFLNICQNFSPFIEVFSIDEVFMDITKTAGLFGGTYKLIEKIKKTIRQEIGEYVTASIGISHNKLLAKMASSVNKPDGIYEINQNNLDEVFRTAKLTDICGIGDRIKNRLNRIGIYNLFDLRQTPYYSLVKEFGNVEAEFLKNVSFGHDPRSLVQYNDPKEVKSVGRNYCLPKNEYDKKKIIQNFYELCEEVGIKLRSINKKAKTVGFSLRGNINIHGLKTFKEPFDTGKEIFDKSLSVIKELSYSRNLLLNSSYVRQISIWVSDLEEKHHLQLSLFQNEEKKERLTKIIDKINEKFGDHTLRSGFLLYADKLTTVPNGFSKAI